MRIGLLASGPIGPGGTTTARVLPIARALAAAGHSVDVHIPGPSVESGADDNANPRVLGFAARWIFGWPLIGALVLAISGGWRLWRGRYDAVHVFKPTGGTGLAAALLWLLRSGPVVVLDTDACEGSSAQSPLEFHSALWRYWADFQERIFLHTNDAVTTASAYLLERVAAGRPKVRIPNFCDPMRHRKVQREQLRVAGRAALGIPAESPVILIYTRFAEFPVDSYADLIAAVLDQIPACMVLVLGDGLRREDDRLRSVLSGRGLGGRVLQLGWVEGHWLWPVLASCDVACMPALATEANAAACPARFVDLLVAGLPVVAHDVGEAETYVMPGRNGRLLPAGSGPRRLAAAVAQLLADPRGRDVMHYSRTRIEGDLAPRRAASALEGIYAQAKARRVGALPDS